MSDILYDEAVQAIRDVHSDQSVSLEVVLDRLENLREEVVDLICCIQLDITNRDKDK